MSDDPFSISAAVTVAKPVVASRFTVRSCVTTVGAVESTTVTVAVAVSELPASSVTVKVTVLFDPRFEQS